LTHESKFLILEKAINKPNLTVSTGIDYFGSVYVHYYWNPTGEF